MLNIGGIRGIRGADCSKGFSEIELVKKSPEELWENQWKEAYYLLSLG